MTLLQYKQIDWNAPMENAYSQIYCPLAYAAREGYVMIVGKFLSRYSGHYAKGSPGHEIICMNLCAATEASHIEVAKILLDYGIINVNYPLTKKLKHHYKCHSLLGIAIQESLKEMVKFLLHYGADVNGETRSVIPSVGSVNDIETLEDNYESVHEKYDQHLSPLKIAVLQRNTAILDALCSSGADIMAKDSSGATLIHFLAQEAYGHRRFQYREYVSSGDIERNLEYLIQKGVDIAAIDNSRCTALHAASRHNVYFDKLAPLIVNAGTPINAQNNEGDTALSISISHSMIGRLDEDVLLLLSLGADCSILDNDGLTALDKASKRLTKSPPNPGDRQTYRSIIKHLTIAARDKILEDIWRLFVDDS
ncbi:hypothetical protein EAE96_006998 [Botrytis aclada]|nr:hypothetical protein EAE96_006998 [Botrytis aclada]